MSKYRLSDSFPYLLARAGARMGELFADELAELGITLPMYRVMAALWERDGQRLSELSDMIGVEISTLSRMIGTMKTAGYLSRRRMEGDERSVKISLTASGRKQVERLIPRAQHYEALATHGFSPLELEEIKERLRKVLSNLTPTESRGPL